MLTDEKFAERAMKFVLLKNVDNKYFTIDEYKELVKGEQTDKDGTLVLLYTNDKEAQYAFVESAKGKAYDVLVMDGQLDTPVMNMLEQKLEKSKFTRVDSDVVDKLIAKNDAPTLTLTTRQKSELEDAFRSQLPKTEKVNYNVSVEALSATEMPVVVTQNEWMRRMKEMSAVQGGMMSFYGEMPDSFGIVVNANHPLVERLLSAISGVAAEKLAPLYAEMDSKQGRQSEINKANEGKKDEEISTADKDELDTLRKAIDEINTKKQTILSDFAKDEKLVSQLIDLALLSNNMLKGEALTKFVKRSIDLM